MKTIPLTTSARLGAHPADFDFGTRNAIERGLTEALGTGDGSASRASLATAVVGGQALCLLVTLLMTPVIYSTFDDLRGLRVFSRIRFPRWRTALASRIAWGQNRAAPPQRPPRASGASK